MDKTDEHRNYLDPRVLARISGLALRARLIVEGYFSGMHRSPYRGLSIEFASHRQYVQGDDLRHIDWKVYGRTDRYYIKEYEQETNLNCVLLVDRSASMSYRSDEALMTKHDYAASLAAAIAYLALRQRDAVGLACFDQTLKQFVRPSNNSGHWKTILTELEGGPGPGKTSIGSVLSELAERLSRRTLIFVISDMFDDVDTILRGLKHLRYRRHEVVICNLWDPAELTFKFRGPMLFDGLEGSGQMLAEPGSLRERYLAEVERFRTTLQAGCSRLHIDYVTFDTSTPLNVALSAYLASRASRIRQRSSRVLGKG